MKYSLHVLLQACDGSIAGLRQALLDINRSDAVSIIDRALMKEQGGASTQTETAPTRSAKTAPGVWSCDHAVFGVVHSVQIQATGCCLWLTCAAGGSVRVFYILVYFKSTIKIGS